MQLGFVGVGIMGAPMAGRLQAAGHDVHVARHRSPIPSSLLDAGVTVCRGVRAVAARADVVFTMVPGTADVEQVLFADDGVASGLRAGSVVVDMSSIDPEATRRFAGRIAELGSSYLDAPVSGGEIGAQEGTLTIMVGGPSEAFNRVAPLFAVMGRHVTRVGASGAGQTAKVANQIIVALTIAAVGEALLFASKAGVDPARVRDALMGGFAGSKILEIHGRRMITRAFEPGARIDLHRKDLGLALRGARVMGLGLPLTATAQELFNACAAHGWQSLDHAALVRPLELLANHTVAGT